MNLLNRVKECARLKDGQIAFVNLGTNPNKYYAVPIGEWAMNDKEILKTIKQTISLSGVLVARVYRTMTLVKACVVFESKIEAQRFAYRENCAVYEIN